jgi:hypothetical protein
LLQRLDKLTVSLFELLSEVARGGTARSRCLFAAFDLRRLASARCHRGAA